MGRSFRRYLARKSCRTMQSRQRTCCLQHNADGQVRKLSRLEEAPSSVWTYWLIDDPKLSVGQLSQLRTISTDKLPAPPQALCMLLLQRAEPVLPTHSADKTWWRR